LVSSIHTGERPWANLLFFSSNSRSDVVLIHRALQDSADRLRSSFQALGPDGGYLSTKKARDVLVKTGLEKDQLRKIWNLSDIDRDGLFDHDEYGKCLLRKRGSESSRLEYHDLIHSNSRSLSHPPPLSLCIIVVAMFLCDAVLQKGRPIPTELPTSVIPPSKRELVANRNQGGRMNL
jgi:EH domain-containing protein 1